MGRTSSARARLTRALAAVALAVFAAAWRAQSPVTAPIVGGTTTTDFPAVGVLLAGADPASAVTNCTGTLVGCRTILTAAHCVCPGTGAECQGMTSPPAGAVAFFAHAGFVPIERIDVHPDYVFPVADVALVRLAADATAIAPLGLNDVATPPFGTSGTIVGFGWQSHTARDTGLKRVGAITTAPCSNGISDATSVCWDYHGTGANTCTGDSGGPLLVDLGTSPRIAGTTSGGFSPTCLPSDHSYDANVFLYRDWIATTAAGDLGTSACGGIPAVGQPGAIATGFTGDLGSARPFAIDSIGVAPGTSELRVSLQGAESALTDFDLYVRGGRAPDAGTFDCSATGPGQYGFCRITSPAPGSWYLRAEQVRGEGLYQIVATTIGGEPSVCGNGVREPSERCDGADMGTCTTGCDAACSCLQCTETDLDVRQIALSPKLFITAGLGDEVGTYVAVDPVSAGVALDLIDATHEVPIVIPPRDPGWVLANPRRGRYRWRGAPGSAVRRVLFRIKGKRPTEWLVTVVGKNVPGTKALDYQTLIVRLALGDRCSERRFHVENAPRIPR